ncbi:thiamine pyrophosphate-binding protein [Thalassobaculum sp.]|uniref:thiamine pyrophosphate-binding protein n=1 Tax=Thalassobaculum sp. TaxID=2022740 RepID=UPI0032EEC860
MTMTDWSKQLFDDLVEAGVTLFSYVPDAGNKKLIEHVSARNDTTAVLLTTEEEGVAICAGADLVGRRSVVCMQSSGVGNVPNFLSFVKGGNFPILMIVSMRGDYGEQNPWQYPMGQAVEPILTAMGVGIVKVDSLDDLRPATQAALSAVFAAGQSTAIVLTQRFLGAKQF